MRRGRQSESNSFAKQIWFVLEKDLWISYLSLSRTYGIAPIGSSSEVSPLCRESENTVARLTFAKLLQTVSEYNAIGESGQLMSSSKSFCRRCQPRDNGQLIVVDRRSESQMILRRLNVNRSALKGLRHS